MISVREMKPTDIPSGLSLCRAAGWNQLSRDWELFLNQSPNGCLVALDDSGAVIGTVTTIRYQNHFSWIGMVLIDPAHRKKGVGLQLLKESLKVLENDGTVKLDATPEGREVYLKLNFIDEYRLSRMLCTRIPTGKFLNSGARSAQSTDFSAIFEFDNKIFGADRRAVLESSLEDSPELAWVTESDNRITGYCLGRQGHNFTHLGPVVAEDVDIATKVVSAVLQNCVDKPVILDTTLHSTAWLSWLSSLGFIEQRPFVRMFRGTNGWPGVPEKQYAILGPEFG